MSIKQPTGKGGEQIPQGRSDDTTGPAALIPHRLSGSSARVARAELIDTRDRPTERGPREAGTADRVRLLAACLSAATARTWA